jgi:hypothetical protein
MREQRHLPRVCHTCRVPMARQEAACWRCGTQWASEGAPPTRLAVIAGGARGDDRPGPAIAVASGAASDVHLDRWANEGGSLVAEAAR